ncbi:Clavaminate synthase-like protein [Aspergillus carlsbadensis]|nr:Clavaminate synthase-like protein [Aspergillus carlsbadensis]
MAIIAHRSAKMRQMSGITRRAVQTYSQAHRPRISATASLPFTIPQLNAHEPSLSQDRTHVGQIHKFLNDRGILKITLSFSDNDSRYLEMLVRSLHRYHDHGLPITHSASRGWFWDVRPTQPPQLPTAEDTITRHIARSETMKTFPWHTDCSYEAEPPRFFALHVLQEDQCGGGVLSVLQVDSLLRHLSPSTKQALAVPEFKIHVPPEFIKADDELSIVGNLLSPGPQSHHLRLREDIVSPLTDRAKVAMDELGCVLRGPQIETNVVHLEPAFLAKRSIILIDNRRWLHARSDVRDPRRHLRRVRWDARPFD